MRHMDAGMACPDAPLCLGQVVPPLVNAPITAHFLHRVLALIVAGAVVWFAVSVGRSSGAPQWLRGWSRLAVALVLLQVALGFASVLTVLAVVPVSLHSLVAAGLLAVLVHVGVTAQRSVSASTAAMPIAIA